MENNDGWEEIGKVRGKSKDSYSYYDVPILVKLIGGKAFYRIKGGQAIGLLSSYRTEGNLTFTAETCFLYLAIPIGIIKQFNS